MIVPLYVAGVCTSYVLQRRAGLLHDNSVENAALLVGFSAFAVGSLRLRWACVSVVSLNAL